MCFPKAREETGSVQDTDRHGDGFVLPRLFYIRLTGIRDGNLEVTQHKGTVLLCFLTRGQDTGTVLLSCSAGPAERVAGSQRGLSVTRISRSRAIE